MSTESIEREKRQFELEKLEFEKSLELRNFEIKNFWTRAWFFGALMVAIASAYFEVSKDDTKPSAKYQIYLAFLGLLVSLFQCLMNRGSKYWQERWENKTKNRESQLGIDVTKTKGPDERWLLDAGTLAKNENFFSLPRRYSVTKLTILVWDIITIAWCSLWITNMHLQFEPIGHWDWATIGIHALIIFYILAFFLGKRQSTTLEDGKKDKKFWIHWIRWENGGGGKVFERYVKKEDHSTHALNVDHRYYSDSENYVKNDIDKLKQIHKSRIETLFSSFAEGLLDDKVNIHYREGKVVPEFSCLKGIDSAQRKKLNDYWGLLDHSTKPFS